MSFHLDRFLNTLRRLSYYIMFLRTIEAIPGVANLGEKFERRGLKLENCDREPPKGPNISWPLMSVGNWNYTYNFVKQVGTARTHMTIILSFLH